VLCPACTHWFPAVALGRLCLCLCLWACRRLTRNKMSGPITRYIGWCKNLVSLYVTHLGSQHFRGPRTVPVSPCHCVTVSLCHCATVLLCHCAFPFPASLCHCVTVPPGVAVLWRQEPELQPIHGIHSPRDQRNDQTHLPVSSPLPPPFSPLSSPISPFPPPPPVFPSSSLSAADSDRP